MTVVSTTSRWPYNGDGSTTVFPYDNLIFAASDLEVFVDGTLQTLNTDYTVSGVGDNGGGSVTFGVAPPTGTNNVVLVRNVPATQGTDLPAGGPFPAAAVEEALDKNTVLSQQIDDSLNSKALALSSTDPAISINRLPRKTTLSGMFLAFDADGEPIAAAGTSADLSPVSSFMNDLLDDGDAATARATLGLGALAVLGIVSEIAQNLNLTGIISPTQLTASQNNYDPTDLATASTLRLSADAARTITGLAGGATGRALILENVGSNSIVLADESVSSLAANRFALTSSITLQPDDAVVLKYDSTSARWRAIAVPSAPSATTIQTFTSSGTWTRPTGCKSARVRVQGPGGGGGGSNTTNNRQGGGGGAGGHVEALLDVTSIASSTITVGTGGAAGTSTTGGGSGSGSSIWSDGTNTLTAAAGVGGNTGTGAGARASGGSATGGDINIAGQDGGSNGATANSTSLGIGGNCSLGYGGQTLDDAAGQDGKGFGSGGSGGHRAANSRAGGAGTPGIVIVEEFY